LVMQSPGLIAPLQVTDLGEAVANIIMQAVSPISISLPSVIELGGNETVSIAAYLQLLRMRNDVPVNTVNLYASQIDTVLEDTFKKDAIKKESMICAAIKRFQFSNTKPALQFSVPPFLVRAASHLFDVFALTPLSFGHFELMQVNNVPSYNFLPILLNRAPALVGNNNGDLDAILTKKSDNKQGIDKLYLKPSVNAVKKGMC
jgi:hypothetical protein